MSKHRVHGRVITPREVYSIVKRRRIDDQTYNAIDSYGGIPSIDNVADALGIKHITALKRIHRLEAKGLVKRKRVKSVSYIHLL